MRAPEFWTGNTPAAKFCAAMLAPIGTVYGISIRWRAARARPYRPRAHVLCVGNLTAGGTGKTPAAITIASRLARLGKIVFLTRGYRGRLTGPVVVDCQWHSAADIGDEALLLARHAPTIVARNRAAGAQLADELGAEFIVMDDGFQNFQIAKDMAIIVVDAAIGFSNGKVIPAGPLREPVQSGLARADAIILTGDGSPEFPPFPRPILRANLIPQSPELFRGRKVLAFAGIGRPQKFFDMLTRHGAELVGSTAFPDHHPYSSDELEALAARAQSANALLVTTEKDYVRISPNARLGILAVPVRIRFDDASNLDSLLARLPQSLIHAV
jgi:tetraacyldisaccharide 4'-kinase